MAESAANLQRRECGSKSGFQFSLSARSEPVISKDADGDRAERPPMTLMEVPLVVILLLYVIS